MPRKGQVEKRKIIVDPVYGDETIARFMNKLMLDGKKGTAEKIFYGALDIIAAKTGKDPVKVFKLAMETVSPQVEVRPRRVGGATYQVPTEVRPERKRALAMRWIVGNSRKRGGKTMTDKLAAELLDASEGKGASVKKREDTHKMAEANKAFSHYKW
ncbi:30S ribosomal protein S7 [bacterium]|jgi:small subunit ribosomal protein S7|nr:30S ribosomal protein S7 [bacterium]